MRDAAIPSATTANIAVAITITEMAMPVPMACMSQSRCLVHSSQRGCYRTSHHQSHADGIVNQDSDHWRISPASKELQPLGQ